MESLLEEEKIGDSRWVLCSNNHMTSWSASILTERAVSATRLHQGVSRPNSRYGLNGFSHTRCCLSCG